jgi:hypothetical protein
MEEGFSEYPYRLPVWRCADDGADNRGQTRINAGFRMFPAAWKTSWGAGVLARLVEFFADGT